MIGDSHVIYYYTHDRRQQHHIRRAHAYVQKSPSTTVWPGSHLELDVPEHIPAEGTVAVEPRIETRYAHNMWPNPEIIDVVAGKIRIVNNTEEPKQLKKNEHFCQVLLTTLASNNITDDLPKSALCSQPTKTLQGSKHCHSDSVKVNQDQTLNLQNQQHFQRALLTHDSLFDPHFSGYNGKVGTFNMKINMGPTQPPQRRGRLPQYFKDKLHILQDKCNELEVLGVLRKPEEIYITVEYLNPPFLVSKPNGGHRLVTAFEDVGRYSKPQPFLMPEIDSTLRTFSQWKYLIVTDLTSAFYQIPLARESMHYCGIVTP